MPAFSCHSQSGAAATIPGAWIAPALAACFVGACAQPQHVATRNDLTPVMVAREANLSVTLSEMPAGFSVSEEFIVQRVEAADTDISGHVGEGVGDGIKGGAGVGLQFGVMAASVAPPAIIVAPVLVLVGSVVGGITGAVVGAGKGSALQANNSSSARRAELAFVHGTMSGALAAGAHDEILRRTESAPFSILVPEGDGGTDPIQHRLLIDLRRFEMKTNASPKNEAAGVRVYIFSYARLMRGDGQEIWRSKHEADYALPAGVNSPEEINMLAQQFARQSGSAIADLAIQALLQTPYQSGSASRFTARDELPRISGAGISETEGGGMKHTVIRSSSEPAPHSGNTK